MYIEISKRTEYDLPVFIIYILYHSSRNLILAGNWGRQFDKYFIVVKSKIMTS